MLLDVVLVIGNELPVVDDRLVALQHTEPGEEGEICLVLLGDVAVELIGAAVVLVLQADPLCDLVGDLKEVDAGPGSACFRGTDRRRREGPQGVDAVLRSRGMDEHSAGSSAGVSLEGDHAAGCRLPHAPEALRVVEADGQSIGPVRCVHVVDTVADRDLVEDVDAVDYQLHVEILHGGRVSGVSVLSTMGSRSSMFPSKMMTSA